MRRNWKVKERRRRAKREGARKAIGKERQVEENNAMTEEKHPRGRKDEGRL